MGPRNMFSMLELGFSVSCILQMNPNFSSSISNRQNGRFFTFEFQFEFWGVLPALFYPYGAFLSESKTPPGVPVRALIIEKRVQNLTRLTTCSSYSASMLPPMKSGLGV